MSSYEVRAIKFIHKICPFIEDCKSLDEYADAVDDFNTMYNRNVQFDNGSARMVMITSDYVIKFDYNPSKVAEWGGCEDEVKLYNKAVKDGFAYMFAKIKPYYYNGRIFYIMPRIHGIARTFCDADQYMTAKEYKWCKSVELYDLHRYNYGWKNNHIVIIDYGCNKFSHSPFRAV